LILSYLLKEKSTVFFSIFQNSPEIPINAFALRQAVFPVKVNVSIKKWLHFVGFVLNKKRRSEDMKNFNRTLMALMTLIFTDL